MLLLLNRSIVPLTSISNRSLPFVTTRTKPPHHFPGKSRNILRSQVTIFCGVPISGELGVNGSEIVESRKNSFSRTNRTPGSFGPAIYRSLPFMTTLAEPPHFSSGKGCNHLGSQFFIFCRMPFGCEFRYLCCKVVEPG